jgi:repressor LexA
MYNLKLIGQRIKEARKEKDMTLDDVARVVGVAKSTIQRYEAGLITTPKLPVLVAIANAIGVGEEWLKGISDDKAVSDRREMVGDRLPVPVLGEVSAGPGKYAQDSITGYILEDASQFGSDGDYVYLRVCGDSMYPEFKDGDLVLVRCETSVNSGEYAVVMVEDEMGVVKRVVYGNDYVELQSVNPMYPPRRFSGADVEKIRIFGKVKGMKRAF